MVEWEVRVSNFVSNIRSWVPCVVSSRKSLFYNVSIKKVSWFLLSFKILGTYFFGSIFPNHNSWLSIFIVEFLRTSFLYLQYLRLHHLIYYVIYFKSLPLLLPSFTLIRLKEYTIPVIYDRVSLCQKKNSLRLWSSKKVLEIFIHQKFLRLENISLSSQN